MDIVQIVNSAHIKLVGGSNLEVIKDSSTSNVKQITINHTSVGASSVDNSGNTFIQDLTIDANGHVTGTASTTITSPNNAQHIMEAQGGLLVNTPGGSNFTADASTNITTTYSLDSDLRGNVVTLRVELQNTFISLTLTVDR